MFVRPGGRLLGLAVTAALSQPRSFPSRQVLPSRSSSRRRTTMRRTWRGNPPTEIVVDAGRRCEHRR